MTSPPLEHRAPATLRERLAAWIGPAFAVIAFLAAAWLLHRELRHHSWSEIFAKVSAIPPRRVVLALILTALNYSILSGYDGLALWYLKHPLRWSQIMLGAFIGYAMSHNFTWMLGGTATRFRLYTSWGLSGVKLIKLFERLGWATNVKHPKPEQIEAKRRGAAEAEPEMAQPEAEKTPVAA
jgi:uncharacterized membrane protein YbhN (UPF0104 family)